MPSVSFEGNPERVSPAGIHHVGLHVQDIDRSLDFYRDIIGLQVTGRRRSEGDYVGDVVGLPGAVVEMAWLRSAGSGAILELLQYVEPAPRRVSPSLPSSGTAHVALRVADIHAAVDRLRAHGLNPRGRPVQVTAGANKGGWAFYLEDPDGFHIELVQPPER